MIIFEITVVWGYDAVWCGRQVLATFRRNMRAQPEGILLLGLLDT
jgi:hypothetical protein